MDQSQALRFALDVARGMEFLHSMEPMIPSLTLNSKHVMVIDQCELPSLLHVEFLLQYASGTVRTIQSKLNRGQSRESSRL